MKKAIISLLLLAAGCSEATTPEYQGETIDVYRGRGIVYATPSVTSCDFEGHHYIIAYSANGCCIIHAPNCLCQKED